MPVRYEVRLKNHVGERVAVLSDFEQLSCGHKVNATAPFGVQLGGSDYTTRDIEALQTLFGKDYQVEIWRRWPEMGIAWYPEYAGLHRRKRIWRDDQGWHLLSTGYDYNHLLWRVIVQAFAGEPESAKSGKAESVMKAYVTEQMVTRLALSGFSVEADGAGGNDWSGNGMGKRLLDLCASIATTGGGDFQVVGAGAAAWEFRWYAGQLGTDRRSSVLFALNYDTMDDPVLEEIGEEYNAILVAGGGRGAARDQRWVTDAGSLALSPWNRVEQFRDARDVTKGDTATLDLRGEAEIAQNKLKKRFTFRAKQSAGRVYGRDYFVGDLAAARFLSTDYDRKITGATIGVDRDHAEEVQPEMSEI